MSFGLLQMPDIYSLQEAVQLFDQLSYSDAITREIKRELAQKQLDQKKQAEQASQVQNPGLGKAG
jgi:hypothetical protein